MKHILKISLLIAIIVNINLLAQMGGNPQERMKRNLEELKTRLKLSEVQFSQIDSLMKEQNNEMMKLRESNNGDMSSMRSAFMELREKYDKKIEALLTDEQKSEYKKILEERRQRFQGMR